MQSIHFLLCGLLAISIAGCDGKDAITKDAPAPVSPVAKTRTLEASPEADQSSDQRIALTPENTKIEFVGNHKKEDPMPRLGSFKLFAGEAIVEGALKSVRVEIETGSLATEFEKLDTHLKNADFFHVETFPKAKFESTQIEDNGDGTVEIKGQLTMLGNTNDLTFPATVSTDDGLKLKAEFQLDRTLWGMDFGKDDVEEMVEVTITVEESPDESPAE